jgi:hypothetical protein
MMPIADFPRYASKWTDLGFSQNNYFIKLPVASVPQFQANLAAGRVRGTVLWLDYPFPPVPGNLGHWAELLVPAYCQLALGEWRRARGAVGAEAHLAALLFPTLRRADLQASAPAQRRVRCTMPGGHHRRPAAAPPPVPCAANCLPPPLPQPAVISLDHRHGPPGAAAGAARGAPHAARADLGRPGGSAAHALAGL